MALALALAPASGWAEPVEVAQAVEPVAPVDEEELDAAADEPAVAPPSDVEVIRIKGRGVSTIETDVPASVTQFDAAAIEALGAENISDLAKVTPNVEIRTAGSTSATFFIRGVGLSDFSANAAGAVAIYQDGVPKNAPAIQLGQLFDLENVEVLRGPQSISSDRNASAGSIKIYSRRPTGELVAQLRTSVGAYGSDLASSALLQDYEGALEAPIIDETLSARLAFRFRTGEPYETNGCSGDIPSYDERGLRVTSFPGQSERVVVVDVSKANAFRGTRFCGEGLQNTPIAGVFPPRNVNNLSWVPGGLPARVGDLGNWSARGQLRFQPAGSEMDWLLNLHGGRLDQQSTLGQAIGTGAAVPIFGGSTRSGYTEPDSAEERTALLQAALDAGLSFPDANAAANQARAANLAENRPLDIRPYRGDYDRVGQTTLDSWGAVLRGDMRFGPVSFTTISGYDTYDRFRETDLDFTPNRLFEGVDFDDAWQFSQELRFNGELADTPFRWEAGGYYLMENLFLDSTLLTRGGDTDRTFVQDTWSFAFFGNLSWDFLDDFTLEGGVRYNWDRKLFDFTRSSLGIPAVSSVTEKTWSAPTGSLSLTYRFREDVSAYWKYTRGWKPGTFNAQTSRPDQVSSADPETIDAFEVGLRGRWLDGRLALGGALFYYMYQDYQVFVVSDNAGSPPVLEVVNADDAEIYGAEIDMTLEPLAGWAPQLLDGLVLTGRFGWLESQFLDFTNEVFRNTATFPPLTLPLTVDFSGNQLINSPRFKVSASAEWTFDLGRWGALVPRYDLAWSDDIFFDPTEGRGSVALGGNVVLPEFAVGQPAFLLQNLRLAYRTPEGNIEIAGWVRNLTDAVYKRYAFDASNFADVVINFTGQPRTFGVDLSINW